MHREGRERRAMQRERSSLLRDQRAVKRVYFRIGSFVGGQTGEMVKLSLNDSCGQLFPWVKDSWEL